MSRKHFHAPGLFINRELSWLEFNDRVLREGLSETVPLLERLKFLAIVNSNLDEFFMIRVAALMQQCDAQVRKPDRSGLSPTQLLSAISQRVHQMVGDQCQGVKQVLNALRSHGLHVVGPKEWTAAQAQFLRNYFLHEVQPVLTPVAVKDLEPSPLLPGLQLSVAVLVSARKDQEGKPTHSVMVVPVPARLPRLITLPGEKETFLARLEDVIEANVSTIMPHQRIVASAVFRVTRDADVAVQDDLVSDLLESMAKAVLDRRRRRAVRLTISPQTDGRLKKWLVAWLKLREPDIYEIDGIQEAATLMAIYQWPGLAELRDPDWPPLPPQDLTGQMDIFQAILEHDVLLFHPYDSFDAVLELLERAADDPGTLAIKQTLYRTSGDSPIVKALERAAQNGKEVTVLVELKARFDEARNIQWARRLEDAGCLVIYGVVGMKTHAKALLIIRREPTRLRRYVHLGTGNYNDKTARLYSDIGVMTCDNDIATDVAAFFNLLSGYSEVVGWSELAIAPTDMRRRFLELIDREIKSSTPDHPGLIRAKMNSLEDEQIIRALYRASAAGVRIQLNIRGLCCLRPGQKKVSETIEVVSILDRYLEHARIFYFRNGGHEEVYMGSADWMTRNLDKRLELLFPIKDANLRRRLVGFLDTYFADNVKSCRMLANGHYEKKASEQPPLRAQQKFYEEAVNAVRQANLTQMQFKPIKAPQE